MRHTCIKLYTLFLCIISLNICAEENFTWQEKDYQHHFIDFNHDGIADLLLQSLTENEPSLLISGEIVNEQVKYLPINQQTLPQHIDQNIWSVTHAQIVVTDLNGDKIHDLFIVFDELQLALTYLGTQSGIDFSLAPTYVYSKKELEWLSKQSDFDFYRGDFNGDGTLDLLALSQNKHKHYLMHSDAAGRLTTVQKINKGVRWAKIKTAKIMIADYNGDGNDDVFSLAKKKNGANFFILANEDGKLEKATQIANKLQGKDWNSDDYTIITGLANDDNTLDLIRLNNMPGGIDENREKHATLEAEDVDDLNNVCDQLYISVTGDEGLTCYPWKANNGKGNTTSDEGGPVNIYFPDEDDRIPPPSPSSAPDVAGSGYYPKNSTITVSENYDHSTGLAPYFDFYTSDNNSTYTLVGRSGLSKNVTARGSYGSQYFKYKACNPYGCSGYSPYRQVTVYGAPGTPSSISSSTYSRNKAQSYTITFGYSAQSVSGTSYTLSESHNNGSYQQVCTKVRAISLILSYSCTIGGKSKGGTYKYKVVACNPSGAGCSSERYISSAVTVINKVPSISGSPSTTGNENSSYSFTPIASDSDNDTLTFSITNKPSWATFSSTTGKLSGTPNYSQVGTYSSISIKVTDGEATKTLNSFNITVMNINRAPSISGSPSTSGSENSSYSFTPNASDPDNDSLSFSITNKPSWATFTSSTGKLSGTPSYSQAGNYSNISIKVSDGAATTSLTSFTITIANINRSPTISGSPSTSVAENSYYSFTPSASDPDYNSLSFSIVNKPSWATFSSSTGKLYGTPSYSQSGSYSNIRITVSDGSLSKSLSSFTISVSNANRAPYISGTPATTVDEENTGASYSFTPTVTDIDEDIFTFSVDITLPNWLSFDPVTGSLTGTPQANDVGIISNIIIIVTDGTDTDSLPAFNIEVSAATPTRQIIFIHTDLLGTPVTESTGSNN